VPCIPGGDRPRPRWLLAGRPPCREGRRWPRQRGTRIWGSMNDCFPEDMMYRTTSRTCGWVGVRAGGEEVDTVVINDVQLPLSHLYALYPTAPATTDAFCLESQYKGIGRKSGSAEIRVRKWKKSGSPACPLTMSFLRLQAAPIPARFVRSQSTNVGSPSIVDAKSRVRAHARHISRSSPKNAVAVQQQPMYAQFVFSSNYPNPIQVPVRPPARYRPRPPSSYPLVQVLFQMPPSMLPLSACRAARFSTR